MRCGTTTPSYLGQWAATSRLPSLRPCASPPSLASPRSVWSVMWLSSTLSEPSWRERGPQGRGHCLGLLHCLLSAQH
jgi:hypothetical protein